MDEFDLSLSADVSGDATGYIQDAVDGVGSVTAVAEDATAQIQSTLGMIGRGVGAVSGVLGNFGFHVGGVASPTAMSVALAPGAPQTVQVGSTMRNTSGSAILYILLAVVAVVVLVYALG